MHGTAPDDKEKQSFPVRIGAVCPLPGDDLTVRASPDPEVPWAEDILSLMDSLDLDPNSTPVLGPPDPAPSTAPDEEDYLEVRGLYLYRVHLKPRTTRYSPFEFSEMLPWNLENIDIFRTTEPKDGTRDESYWTNHAEDLSVLMYDAQGVPVPWTGTTRFELVLPPNIFKENGRNYMWVRPWRKTQYQKITRPPDCVPEYWATIGEYKKRQEIMKWQQRKKDIDEAIAKRSLPRVPVDPCE